MKAIITSFAFIAASIVSNHLLGQTTIDIAENTLKVKGLGEEVFYYGFCEGDQLVFNFEEEKGKELKEIEIMELPGISKFMDFKTSKIENKIINIPSTGIYKFRFTNGAIVGRICKFKIQRIATEQTKKFNTNVYWQTIYDTSYNIIQEKYLVRSDTSILNLVDQVAKVHSQLTFNSSKTTFNFTIPPRTVAWSYYVGVDQGGQQAYEAATKDLTKNAAPLIAQLTGYNPLAALALGGISYLTQLQKGEDIDYWIVEGSNVNAFQNGQPFNYVKKGKVINGFAQMLTPLEGEYHFCLSNDNAITGVSVAVKITAIQVNQVWNYRPVEKMNVVSRLMPYLKNSF